MAEVPLAGHLHHMTLSWAGDHVISIIVLHPVGCLTSGCDIVAHHHIHCGGEWRVASGWVKKGCFGEIDSGVACRLEGRKGTVGQMIGHNLRGQSQHTRRGFLMCDDNV